MNFLQKAGALLSLLVVLAVPTLADDATQVKGTITAWDISGLTLRSEGKDWRFDFDPDKSMVTGHPVVDTEATVWYKKTGGNMILTKLDTAQKGGNVGNYFIPQVGQLQGQVVKLNATQLVVRAGGEEWTFGVDDAKTMVEGKPAIDSNANVTFWKDKAGSLWALFIEAI